MLVKASLMPQALMANTALVRFGAYPYGGTTHLPPVKQTSSALKRLWKEVKNLELGAPSARTALNMLTTQITAIHDLTLTHPYWYGIQVT